MNKPRQMLQQQNMHGQFLDGFVPFGTMPAAPAAPAAPPAEPTDEPGTPSAPAEPGAPHQGTVNPWEIPDTNENVPGGAAPGSPSAPAAPAAPAPTGPNLEAINKAIDDMDLAADFNLNEVAQEMGVDAASLSKLHDGLKGMARKIFLQSMTAARRMQEQSVGRIKKEVSMDAQGTLRFDSAQASLESKLPMLKDPAMAPVARASLKSFLDKGMSMEAAVDSTVKYFQQVHGNLSKHFRGQDPNARPGGMPGGFGEPHLQTEPGGMPAGEPDWLELFGGNDS